MLRALTAVIRQLSLFDSAAPAPAPTPSRQVSLAEAPPKAEAGTSPAFASLCRGPYAHIRVETGARLRDSWKVTWTRRQEAMLLRVPSALEEAPEAVKQAALAWALLVCRRSRKPDPALKQQRRRFETLIRDFLQGNQGAENPGPGRSRRLASNRRRIGRLRPKGECHDLDAVFAGINAEYFGGTLEVRLTWASRLGGLSTHRMAEDGEGRPYHLITISRGYDCPEVTAEILGGVVYHECLHAVIPPRVEDGRRVVHGRDFKAREREYAHYADWRKWHREGLPKALRRMIRRG